MNKHGKKIFCIHCGTANPVLMRPDGASLKPCLKCQGEIVSMDQLLLEVGLGDFDHTLCKICRHVSTGSKFCYHCGNAFY